MAAEVDFGDRELFQQLEADEEAPSALRPGPAEEAAELRERLRDSEETVRQLRAENQELRRKLNILTRPSGLTVDDCKLDGPLLQILFMNNTVSKQYHQDIEEFVSSLVQKYEEQQRSELDKTCFNVKPQPSSFVLEEDQKVTSSNVSKKVKEAFSVIGSVLYFTNFCLDKLGQPILNENPQLTDGWEIPKYQQVFTQILSLDGQEIQVKSKRPKSHCFNCGSEDHQMKDCPQPRNSARINEKRKAFMEACGETGSPNFQQRYHADEVEERFGRFKPGIISEELQDALGVTEKTLPPFIYRMRQLGYPPGWLKEAEMEKSGLTLYDGKASPSSEAEEESHQQNPRVTYDLSKLINYPGFNMSTPSGVADEWRMFGSVPLQPSQQKEIFAHYLSTYHSANLKSRPKRPPSRQSSHHSKRQKGSSVEIPPADMEIDSDLEMPPSPPAYDGFHFQPPLPPGSPLTATPPPLPQGTPPGTPPSLTSPPLQLLSCVPAALPRDTPPWTPSAPRPEDSAMDEDTLTLEELEEQQRLIWAALEQAESANSDSDLPAGTPMAGNSGTSTPCRTEPSVPLEEAARQPPEVSEAEPEPSVPLEEAAPQPPEVSEAEPEPSVPLEEAACQSPEVSEAEPKQVPQAAEEPGPQQAIELVDLTAEAEAIPTDSEGRDQTCSSDPAGCLNHSDAPALPNASESPSSKPPGLVPDMSKFAAGITPFEYDNMSESTGTYLRIRSVLKKYPRSQLKNKKLSL
ncbi:zinc finger CCHC domain-containing protein 8 isoform X2 [Notechis scutatus]|uniref:Zinc finger CCHC domain-containing protein 8 n=1 Tax=Notechis scutatus TaxID=8663 RepID=A0A6J1VI48_9SAUR|nr:zinc finger CCHC domain-containing protein 8 isoform X2 [Notechis scutatus]